MFVKKTQHDVLTPSKSHFPESPLSTCFISHVSHRSGPKVGPALLLSYVVRCNSPSHSPSDSSCSSYLSDRRSSYLSYSRATHSRSKSQKSEAQGSVTPDRQMYQDFQARIFPLLIVVCLPVLPCPGHSSTKQLPVVYS